MLKKMMLFAGAAMALVAFAIPAVASADTWTVGGKAVGSTKATGETITGHGSLSATLTTGLGLVHLGPCNVDAHGFIWNPANVGHGEIDSFTITAPCPVTNGGKEICTITKATANTAVPWTVKVVGTNVNIEGANFTDVFSAGCPLGAGAEAKGTATGLFTNANSSIGFTEAGDLASAAGPVKLNGSVKLTSTKGAVTLH